MSSEKDQKFQKITPFEVETNNMEIDYDAIIKDFGSSRIDQSLLDRFERLTNQKPHTFLRRGLYFSHRDFGKILDLYEKKKPFYIFTGRGPSKGDMHIGHMIPFLFTAYIQRVFQCPLVIQVNDDEKYFFKEDNLENLNKLANQNIKDILAFGFDKKNTFVFNNTEYIKEMYPNILKIQKRVTFNQVKGIFGFNESSSIGKIGFPAVQAAPSFSSTFKKLFRGKKIPCLIICAIDQDPFFRMTRDVAPRMSQIKPALLHCKFVCGLQGVDTKMSASDPKTAICLNDSPKMVRKKLNQSKSGGQKTVELQRELGANLEVDVPFSYLKFFLDDDEELERIEREYGSGKMMTGEVKSKLCEVFAPILDRLQRNRKEVTDQVVEEFKELRELF